MTGPVLPDQYMADLRATAARARAETRDRLARRAAEAAHEVVVQAAVRRSPEVATTLILRGIDRAFARARTLELLEQRSRLAWTWETTHRAPRDIPDLFPQHGPRCTAVLPLSAWSLSHYPCARREGHTGRHAAGNGTKVVAVWSGRHESALMVCAALEVPRRGTAAAA